MLALILLLPYAIQGVSKVSEPSIWDYLLRPSMPSTEEVLIGKTRPFFRGLLGDAENFIGGLLGTETDGPNIYNNPGNVERTQNWAGSIAGKGYGEDDRPNRFAIFNSPVMGVRALARDIRTKIKDMDGDLLKIISKYAPSIENDTKGYKEFVEKEIGKNNKVTLKDLPEIVKAIIKFENVEEVEDYYLDDPSILNEGIILSQYNLPQNYNLAMARERRRQILANPPPKPKFKPRKKK
jgi:hypothetical protein